MAPFGYQWFSLQDRRPSALLLGVQAAAPLLNAFLDAELRRHGLTDHQLALVGFSQGTMMALYVALRRANRYTRVRSGSAPITGTPERAAALAAVDAARKLT